jgi:hypothetical protein
MTAEDQFYDSLIEYTGNQAFAGCKPGGTVVKSKGLTYNNRRIDLFRLFREVRVFASDRIQ